MTATDVCNMALGRIGQYRINALTEQSAEAGHCNRFFNNTRRSLLRDFDFNFATHYVTLSEVDGAASFDYDHAYQLPSDYLRAIAFDGIKAGTKQTNWRIAGDRIYTDQSDAASATLEYIRDITDVTQWDDTFCTAFSWYLAAAIAPSITGQAALAGELLKAGQVFLSEAKGSDTQEDGLRVLRGTEHSGYQRAREGGMVGGVWGSPWMYQDFGPPGNS